MAPKKNSRTRKISRQLAPEVRGRIMSKIRSKDTRPELFIRSLIHRMGYRFRLHYKHLPGTPDIVFPSRHKVIFVHGCFWHHHDCPVGARMPRANLDYWRPKLLRNQARDIAACEQLAHLGWDNLVIWECEIKETDSLVNKISKFLETS